MSNLFGVFQLIGGIILSIGYIPQVVQIVKTKTAKGLNAKSFGMVFTGILLYEIYAIALAVEGSGQMYLITNTVSLLLVGTVYGLIKVYEKKENREKAIDDTVSENTTWRRREK
ncbi:SemiSWEET family sugar transporter [Ructibacterium gallinarum]|uniref:MtN3 and saliva related transmembrane protein n=1 Tax=Ructibacterium gallinarum TaxID=2779355 RepID=A0A9D5R976_9FIRM|nr:PQ-loop domain-containing transporter [Ructibacterium gallinarum]MBE5040780.1 hypothetical protein [Ructibacterium gallinarum]